MKEENETSVKAIPKRSKPSQGAALGKYLLKISIVTNSRVEGHDIIGAIYSNIDHLLGDEMELYLLQKQGRVGYLSVRDIAYDQAKNQTTAKLVIQASLSRKKIALLAASIETITRIGSGVSECSVVLEDMTLENRRMLLSKAQKFLEVLEKGKSQRLSGLEGSLNESNVAEITPIQIGRERYDAAPGVRGSPSLVLVEGRSDVRRLLELGRMDVIALKGSARIPKALQAFISQKSEIIALMDNDNKGIQNLKTVVELFPGAKIALGPRDVEVEDFTEKQFMKSIQTLRTPSSIRSLRLMMEQSEEESSNEESESETRSETQPVKEDRKIDVPVKRSEKNRNETGQKKNRNETRQNVPKIEDTQKENSKDHEHMEDRSEEEDQISRSQSSVSESHEKLSEDDLLFAELLRTSKKEAWMLSSTNEILQKKDVQDLFNYLRRARRKIHKILINGVLTRRVLDLARKLKIESIRCLRVAADVSDSDFEGITIEQTKR